MQYGSDIKIKKWNPRFLLNSLKDAFLAWIGVEGSQLTLNSVAFSNIKTVKKTIGGVGVAGCDFNFATAANTTEQVIDLGSIVPANARVLDVKSVTNATFTGATTLVAEAGNASSGAQFIASASIYTAAEITAVTHTLGLNVAPVAAASKVYVAATPSSNWSGVTAGKVTYYITFIETV